MLTRVVLLVVILTISILLLYFSNMYALPAYQSSDEDSREIPWHQRGSARHFNRKWNHRFRTKKLEQSTVFELEDPPPLRAPFTELKHLVAVMCHSTYIGNTFDLDNYHNQDNWALEPYMKNDNSTYVNSMLEHIQAGLQLALGDPKALLVFSGGVTRPQGGQFSEAQSYWKIAQTLDSSISSNDSVIGRAVTEDFATDSYTNLLYSLCRFFELTGKWPLQFTVIGYEYKRKRFEDIHLKSIHFPMRKFKYVGIDPPGLHYMNFEELSRKEPPILGKPIDAVLAEFFFSYRPFLADPYGCKGNLRKKKLERNPYRRRAPYKETCGLLIKYLMEICDDVKRPLSRSYHDNLPWLE